VSARFRVARLQRLLVLILLAVVPALASRGLQDWPREAPPRPLDARKVDVPPYELRTLANGLRVLVVLHHEQPAVSFRLLVRAGAVQEPADRPGVASLVASLLNQGTTSRTAQQIATEIDSAGGLLGVGSSNELAFIQGAVIKDRADLALGLVADLAQHPAFTPEEIALQRKQALSSLQVAYDDPDYIANLVFERLLFGLHPYGRPTEGTPDSIARISREDLVAFHRTWYVPNNALLAIVGDLTAAEAFAAADRAFGGWPRGEVPDVAVVDPPAPAERVVVVDRPGSAQTEIRVGQLAIPRTHKDFIPFDLAIRILGGEGANRLFGVLRSDRGLTYGASADLHTFKSSGYVVAETDTRSPATGESLKLVVDEFARLPREAVGAAELQGAQDFIAGNFPLSIETPSAIAEQVLGRLFYGQPLSGIETYVDDVARVTTGDVQRVARDWIHPDRLTIVLVGDASVFASQLPAVGFPKFERIPLSELDVDVASLRRSSAASTSGRSQTPR
jgi:zinc protease